MPQAKLFTPYRVGALELRNRIVIAPMCQYSAVDGCATDWHQIHLGHLALSGAALLTIEATAVSPEGRISASDLGLWSDANEEALRGVLGSVRRWSTIPIAIQLAHAGRNALAAITLSGVVREKVATQVRVPAAAGGTSQSRLHRPGTCGRREMRRHVAESDRR
jgi:2,4-dienoyl-CoA reductase-like NADH-dependent reductase (Old Yellow Enzyme family)